MGGVSVWVGMGCSGWGDDDGGEGWWWGLKRVEEEVVVMEVSFEVRWNRFSWRDY